MLLVPSVAAAAVVIVDWHPVLVVSNKWGGIPVKLFELGMTMCRIGGG